jgi:hypothetical protein
MISFRVSEEEFRTLREVCLGEGFGSFSDLVRTAVEELVSNRSQRGPTAITGAVQELVARVDALDRDLKQLINNWSSTTTVNSRNSLRLGPEPK